MFLSATPLPNVSLNPTAPGGDPEISNYAYQTTAAAEISVHKLKDGETGCSSLQMTHKLSHGPRPKLTTTLGQQNPTPRKPLHPYLNFF